MFTGKLDRLITIEQNTPVQDTFGEPVEVWTTLAQVWAEKLTPTVAERFTGEQFAGFRGLVWRIRFRSDVTNLMRVVYKSNNYDILGTFEVGRAKELILKTEAIL